VTYSTNYVLRLSPKEGETTVNVTVKPEGEIEIIIAITRGNKQIATTTFTFKSDMDIKALIEILKWARVKSLEKQGYKVVL
jgi:hypothetical protein